MLLLNYLYLIGKHTLGQGAVSKLNFFVPADLNNKPLGSLVIH